MTLKEILKLLNSKIEGDFKIGMELAKKDPILYLKIVEIILNLGWFSSDEPGLENVWRNYFENSGDWESSQKEAKLRIKQILEE